MGSKNQGDRVVRLLGSSMGFLEYVSELGIQINQFNTDFYFDTKKNFSYNIYVNERK